MAGQALLGARRLPPRGRIGGWLALAGVILAVAALVMLAVAPLGWRLGWWHYRIAFNTLMQYAAFVGAAAAVSALPGFLLALAARNRQAVLLGVVGLIVGGIVAYVPWSFQQRSQTLPRIHDITTDTDDPPLFVAVLPAREAAQANSVAYEGEAVARLQRSAYPDIVPVVTGMSPQQAYDRALAVAAARGWTIVAAIPQEGRIEASQTSFWFGFTDDIVIRIRPRPDGASGSRLDIRSVSRMGRGDFGVNARRIRSFVTGFTAPA